MSVVERIKSETHALSVEERAALAQHFLSSLNPPDGSPQDEWEASLSRRVAEIRSGTAVGRDVDEVLAELEARFP